MTTPADEDEFSELTDFHPDRVDLVRAAANGTRFLIAKQDATAGLLEPDFVRSLIGKSTPQNITGGHVPDSTATREREQVVIPNGLTLTGSPGDIASFIHKAALAARDREAGQQAVPEPGEVEKAQMSAKSINDLPDSAFAHIEPGGKKDADGKTTPRSLRHYPVQDEPHARNAVGRAAAQIKNGSTDGKRIAQAAMPKIKAAAKKFGIEVAKEADVPEAVTKDLMDAAGDSAPLDGGMDGLDPTVALATPDDEDVPGDPTDPGSPAWEAIDAATAQKWTAILARAEYAIGLLADREMLEAASADPDDAENACDLSGVCDAIDYAISVLAPFAVGEQSEADCGAMEMEAIGKAAGMLRPGDLKVIEGLAAVKKAGRVLSTGNEQAIRSAVASLQQVLDSLPQAPVAKSETKEAAMPATQTAGETPAAPVAKENAVTATPEDQAGNTGPVNAGGTTGLGQPRTTGPAAALPADGPQSALPGDVPGRAVIKGLQVVVYDRTGRQCTTSPDAILTEIAKADGDSADTLTAVFDQNGDLIGVVPASAIQPVAGAGAPDPDNNDGTPAPAPDGTGDDGDMEPQPAADAGTPADAVGKSAGSPKEAMMENVLKGIADAQAALAAQQAQYLEAVAKALTAGSDAQAKEMEVLKARLATVEEQPAVPGVFSNGATPPRDAVPPPAPQFRGQDPGAGQVDVAKALGRKRELYEAPDARQQDQIAKSMQTDAVAALAAVHGAGPRQL
jgi:hypothetical protein